MASAYLNAAQLLKQIARQERDAAGLSKEERLVCVQELKYQGYTTSSIAELLKVTDRQIRRYLEAVREQNALYASPRFYRETAGEYLSRQMRLVDFLFRAAFDHKNPSNKERIAAARAASLVYSETVRNLREMGFLPHLNPWQGFRADIKEPERFDSSPEEHPGGFYKWTKEDLQKWESIPKLEQLAIALAHDAMFHALVDKKHEELMKKHQPQDVQNSQANPPDHGRSTHRSGGGSRGKDMT